MEKNRKIQVMGILNITPDSFYAGSRHNNATEILQVSEKMLEDGADILDLGGMSTRPGCATVDVNEEINRVVPVVKLLRQTFGDITISVDTFRPEVARRSCDEGCAIINDISGGCEEMYKIAAEYNVKYVLMHFIGEDGKMSLNYHYDDIIKEMLKYFNDKILIIKSLGLDNIIIDPGFGFSKTIEENHYILENLAEFQSLQRPILAGISRKSMLYKPLGIKPEDALEATIAAHEKAIKNGAEIIRVHDVKEHVRLKAIL